MQRVSTTKLGRWDIWMVAVGVYCRAIHVNGTRMELVRRSIKFLRLYNPILKSTDAKAFHGWRQDQPSSHENNVSH